MANGEWLKVPDPGSTARSRLSLVASIVCSLGPRLNIVVLGVLMIEASVDQILLLLTTATSGNEQSSKSNKSGILLYMLSRS